jgi:hypothetical protein
MRIVCQQPHYLPWLGYFDLFARADAFVFLDTVQWIKQGRQHRTRVMGPDGKPRWLTVPVVSEAHRAKHLKDMQVDTSQNWARRHWEIVKACYQKAPYFKTQVEPALRPFFEKAATHKFLTDVSQESLWLFWDEFLLTPELHWSSDMKEREGPNERLLSLCEALGADEYYSSLGSTRYIDLSVFRAAGVRVRWQHFKAIFPNDINRPLDLSALDWVAHLPFADVRRLLKTGEARPELSYPSLEA